MTYIRVWVVVAWREQHLRRRLRLPPGSTALYAWRQCGFARHPAWQQQCQQEGIDPLEPALALYGIKLDGRAAPSPAHAVLADGDRVEVLRPARCDATRMRRIKVARTHHQRTKTGRLKTPAG